MASTLETTYQYSADEALARLVSGNERFVRGEARFPTVQKEILAELAKGQHPYATILGCSDSRVPPELVFDAGFGDLFIVRVAGNVISAEVKGTLQYAALQLRAPEVQLSGTCCRSTCVRRHLPFGDDDVHRLSRLEAPVLLFEPDSLERVADITVRVGEAESDAASGQCPLQIGNELGAREIDLRHRAKKEDDEPHGIRARRENREQPVAHVLHVEVQQRRFASHDQNTRSTFVVGVTRAIREVGRLGHARQLGDARTCRLPQQHHDRERRAEQHAVLRAGSENPEKRDNRDSEFAAAEVPDVTECRDVLQNNQNTRPEKRQA